MKERKKKQKKQQAILHGGDIMASYYELKNLMRALKAFQKEIETVNKKLLKERPFAYWERKDNAENVICSSCKTKFSDPGYEISDYYRYCPECGAIMDKKEKEQNDK